MDNGESSYRRYLSGDESAFHDIVKEYFDPLVWFLHRYVRDMATAEDLALDAFAQLVADKRRYNFSVSLKTYLFMLGRSRALDYLRHQRKIPMLPLTDAEEEAGPDPEDLLLADERKRALHAAIGRLHPEVRLAVHLVYFEDLTPAEAARVLRKTRKQVYNLLYRGKTALRAMLGEEEQVL